MANWSGFTLTDVGADLQAKINAGLTTLKFTKVGVGSGSGSGSVNALTAMVHKEQDISISNVEANGNIVTINFTLTNKGLGSAYQMRELGLFATDPDKGEVLFAYMTDSTPDTMPADGSATVVSQAVTLNIAFSNTGNVSATIDTGAFVTHEDLNTHNTSSSAHTDIRAQITSDMNAHNSDTSAHEPLLNRWINKSFSKFKEAVIGVVKGALTDILDIQAKMDENGFVRMGFLWGFTIQWGVFVFSDGGEKYSDATLPLQADILFVGTSDYYWNKSATGMDKFRSITIEGYSTQSKTRIRALTADAYMGEVRYWALTKTS